VEDILDVVVIKKGMFLDVAEQRYMYASVKSNKHPIVIFSDKANQLNFVFECLTFLLRIREVQAL
jgi:hypothetical protein